MQPFTYTGYQKDEVTNTYFAQAREYKAGIGRFIATDKHWNPRNMIYGDNVKSILPDLLAIGQSNNLYVYTLNNPLCYIDLNGRVIAITDEATEEQRQQYESAVEYLQTSERGRELITSLEEAPEVITITFNNDMEQIYRTGTRTVRWDPTGGVLLGNGEHVVSPALALAHELGHAEQHLDGRLDSIMADDSWENLLSVEADNLDITEYPIARELGEFLRADYLDTEAMLRVSSPTEWGTYLKPSFRWWEFWKWFSRREFENMNVLGFALNQNLDICPD